MFVMPREFSPKWERSAYNYYDLAYRTSKKQVEAEYNRLMKEATRRLEALNRSNNETAQRMYREYKDILEAKPQDFKQQVKSTIALEKFISTPFSKVTNIYKAQKQTVETLQSKGYSFVSQRNLKDFGRFMEYMRNAHGMRRGGSGSVMEFLSERGKVGNNPEKLYEAFEKWAEENDVEM